VTLDVTSIEGRGIRHAHHVRPALWLSGYTGVIGLVDPLWCLWDNDRQCVHDKAVNTIVVND
jgi:uncharacterized RDD family membrane protein YckC